VEEKNPEREKVKKDYVHPPVGMNGVPGKDGGEPAVCDWTQKSQALSDQRIWLSLFHGGRGRK